MAGYQRNAGPHADNQGHCSPDDSLVATDPGADNAQTQPAVGLAFNEFNIEAIALSNSVWAIAKKKGGKKKK